MFAGPWEDTMLTRRQRHRRRFAHKKLVLFLIAGLFCSLAIWSYLDWSEAAVTVSSPGLGHEKANHDSWVPKWRDVLFSGIPGLAGTVNKQPVVKVKPEVTVQSVLHGLVLFFTEVDIKDLRSVLKAEIPALAAVPAGQPTVSAMTVPNFPKFDPASMLPKGKPIVGIYHTHTAESFIPSSGAAHKPGGQIGDIVDVGGALVRKLEEHGIPALQSKTIHDYPSFMKAYGVSEATVQQMVTENPSIQMIFDIHRDAGKREDNTVTVNGVQAAKITLVVATGQTDLPQPTWQQNHAFAKLIEAKLTQYYPGLSKGILLVEWRYNQHLHPRSLLLEVGCQENSREEAERSVEFLGEVLAQIIAESN